MELVKKSKNKSEGRDTVLYCLDNECLFISLLMHRLNYSNDKNVVIMVVKSQLLSPILQKMKKNGIFDDVVVLDLAFPKRNSEDFSEQDIIDYYNKLLEGSKYSLDNFDNIYVLNDCWDGDINLYFNLIGQKYTWIEVARNSSNYTPVRLSNQMINLVNKYKSMTPKADYADAFILKNSNVSQKILADNGYQLWDINESIENISEETIDKIAEAYSLNLKNYSKTDIADSALIIQNSYGLSIHDLIPFKYSSYYLQNILGIGTDLSYSVAPYYILASLMNKAAIDFYLQDNKSFYVKNHPNDPYLSAEVLSGLYEGDFRPFTTMPFELVGKLFKYKGIKFGKIITYAHGIDTFDCDEQIILGQNYFYTWFYYCSIYASLLYAQKCGISKIYCSAVLKEQIEFLAVSVNYKAEIIAIDINKTADVKALRDSVIICNFLDDERKELNSFFKNLDQSNAVCFLNVNLTEKFFAEDLYPYFIPVNIRKEKTSQYCFNMQRDEVIWVYSKKRKLRDMALGFTCEKNLHYSGYTMRVTQGTLAAAIDAFIAESKKSRLKEMQKTLDKQQIVINALLAENEGLSLKVIKSETELDKYINLLNSVKNNYLVVLAVRDTPGNILSPAETDLVKKLGFSKFSSELWRMYAGVIYKGKVICDITGEKREDPVTYAVKDALCGIDLKVSSMAWRQGNKAEIIINGTDYAVNIRGINIVVYDVENNKLIDSVAFDYHTENRVCKHK